MESDGGFFGRGGSEGNGGGKKCRVISDQWKRGTEVDATCGDRLDPFANRRAVVAGVLEGMLILVAGSIFNAVVVIRLGRSEDFVRNRNPR